MHSGRLPLFREFLSWNQPRSLDLAMISFQPQNGLVLVDRMFPKMAFVNLKQNAGLGTRFGGCFKQAELMQSTPDLKLMSQFYLVLGFCHGISIYSM